MNRYYFKAELEFEAETQEEAEKMLRVWYSTNLLTKTVLREAEDSVTIEDPIYCFEVDKVEKNIEVEEK